MKTRKRLERLEQECFPDSKRRGFYLYELEFLNAFANKYQDCEDSAPAILRSAYEQLQERWERWRNLRGG